MILPGFATGKPNFNPASGRRAEAGARRARSARALRSPLLRRKASPRSLGAAVSTACRSMTASPSTTPSRKPLFASKPTIFIVSLPGPFAAAKGLAQASHFVIPGRREAPGPESRSNVRMCGTGFRARSLSLAPRNHELDLPGQRKGLDREILALVGPHARRLPTGAARQRAQRRDAVFVAVLGLSLIHISEPT